MVEEDMTKYGNVYFLNDLTEGGEEQDTSAAPETRWQMWIWTNPEQIKTCAPHALHLYWLQV